MKKKAYKTVLGTDYDHIGKIFSMKLSEYILLSMHSSSLLGDTQLPCTALPPDTRPTKPLVDRPSANFFLHVND